MDLNSMGPFMHGVFFFPSNYDSHTICGWLNLWMQNYRYGVLSMGLEHPQYLVYFGGGLVAKLCPTLATPWTLACQAPLSMEFSRQEYWSGFPFPSSRDLPDPGIKPGSPALQILYRVNYEG